MSRILIADDDKITHKIYKKIIEPLGHEVFSFYNGRDAVKFVEKEPVDLIMLDNVMPIMNGHEACSLIRELPNGMSIPIIIISADDTQDSIFSFLNAGANDYLLKPIKEPVLIAKLKNYLKTSSLNRNELIMLKDKEIVDGQYQVKKIIGYGKRSVVFLAEDISNSTKVALKIYNKAIINDFIIKRIKHIVENRKHKKLDNTLQIYRAGEYNDTCYVAMELAENGRDLAGILAQKGRLDEDEIINIAFDISKALCSFEKEGLLHLNIKPSNIIKHGGTYKLCDFGIISNEPGCLTFSFDDWCTPAYASPEFINKPSTVDIKSDIYSLGLILYEAFIGDNFYDDDKASTVMFRQTFIRPTPLIDINVFASVEISVLLNIMLEKQPGRRPGIAKLHDVLHFIGQTAESTVKSLTYLQKNENIDHSSEDLKTIEKITGQIKKLISEDVNASEELDSDKGDVEKGNLSGEGPEKTGNYVFKYIILAVIMLIVGFIVGKLL